MENHVGKTCPYCKTEIKEGEEVKYCSSCGIPHHLACWEENKGCTTFGCKEQHYEAQGTNPSDVCANCGAPLGEGQLFCPKCGASKAVQPQNICSTCGAELQSGQEFCPKCGLKVGLNLGQDMNPAINQFNANINQTNEAKKKKPMKLLIAGIAAVLVIAIAVVAFPKIFVSVDDLCAKGDYVKAYEKADEDEKLAVQVENAAAVQSAYTSDNLKDPNSFELQDVYYNETTNEDGELLRRLVLYISGANSYGDRVNNYWLYTWDEEDHEWSYFCSVSTLERDEYSAYDDTDEKLEKLIDNAGRIIIESTMEDGFKLSNDGVDRINDHFEEDTLDTIELLDIY